LPAPSPSSVAWRRVPPLGVRDHAEEFAEQFSQRAIGVVRLHLATDHANAAAVRMSVPWGEIDSASRTIRSEETRQTTSSPRLETAAPRRVRRDCAPPRARRERHERPYHPPQMYLRRPGPSRGGLHKTKSPCCSSAGTMTATDDDYLAASQNAVLSRISRPASACPRLRGARHE
jgi:hypothetical protein